MLPPDGLLSLPLFLREFSHFCIFFPSSSFSYCIFRWSCVLVSPICIFPSHLLISLLPHSYFCVCCILSCPLPSIPFLEVTAPQLSVNAVVFSACSLSASAHDDTLSCMIGMLLSFLHIQTACYLEQGQLHTFQRFCVTLCRTARL